MSSTELHRVTLAAAAFAALAVSPSAGAQPEPLLLQNERFAVTATWETPQGDSGFGIPLPLTPDTGTFWFFHEDNLEVIVKVLAACPVNDHFWVFAGGLTNVGVELRVEDRLSGQVWERANPVGQAFQPVQDTAAFATCDVVASACGRGTPSGIAATPRADVELEALAVRLSAGITAEQAVYDRLATDIAALEATLELPLDFVHEAEPRQLIILVAPGEDADTIRNGTGWSCLADWYGIEEIDHLFDGYFTVTFGGVYDLDLLAADYREQTSTQWVGENTSLLIEPRPTEIVFCANRTGSTFHYFVDDEAESPRRVEHFTSTPGEAPVPAGSHLQGDPAPPWLPLYEECYEWTIFAS